jgi:diguanylate cyclase (GGDEF)-like protein/PAS domain S-box-containing protein
MRRAFTRRCLLSLTSKYRLNLLPFQLPVVPFNTKAARAAAATVRNLERLTAALTGVEAVQVVPRALRILREDTGASVALVMRESGEPLWADPSDSQVDEASVASLFRKALATGEMVLEGAIAILPIPAGRSFTGAAVLLWPASVVFDQNLCAFLRAAMLLLRTAIPPAAALREIESERDRVAAVLETLPQGVVFVDENGGHAWANREAVRVLKLEGERVTALSIAQAMKRMQAAAVPLDAGQQGNAQTWIWTVCEPEIHVLSIASRFTRVSQVEGCLWLFTDITEQRRAEEELRASEDRYKELFENSPLPAWVYDSQTLAILTVNRAAVTQYGYTREEFLTMGLTDLRPPEEAPKLLACLEGVRKAQQKSGPWIHRRKDGTLLVVEISSHEVSLSGRLARLVMVNDVTERNVAEQRLRDQEQRWQLALRGSNDGLWDYDITNHEVFYSRRWKEMVGYEEHELPNLPEEWETRVHPEDLPGVLAKLNDHLSRRALFYVAEYRMRCRDGSYKWVLARGQAVWSEHGKAVRMVGSHTDITERKQSEAQLTRDALYDALTGLLNRRYVLEELERAVRRAEEQKLPLSLAIGDLDHFKSVNDNHGHAGGDEVLAVFGQIVQQGQRQGEVVGRIGGDEFCMVFPRATASEAAISVERTRARFSTIAFGVSSGVPFSVSATFGVAAWQPGMSGKDLMEAADRALYQAKECGRNRLMLV